MVKNWNGTWSQGGGVGVDKMKFQDFCTLTCSCSLMAIVWPQSVMPLPAVGSSNGCEHLLHLDLSCDAVIM